MNSLKSCISCPHNSGKGQLFCTCKVDVAAMRKLVKPQINECIFNSIFPNSLSQIRIFTKEPLRKD